MRRRIGMMVILALILVATYGLGYLRGNRQAFRTAARGGVVNTAYLHRAMEQGDIDDLRDSLEFQMLWWLRKYQDLSPKEAAANQWWQYAYASERCDAIETRLAVSDTYREAIRSLNKVLISDEQREQEQRDMLRRARFAQPDAAHEPPPAAAVRKSSETTNIPSEDEAPADGGSR